MNQAGDKIIISIEDDGVGMSIEKVNSILSEDKEEELTEFNRIGIKNIDERIKLYYGHQYGLKIESQVGKYTRVSIMIPKED